jgi:hypothetical protein
MMGTFNTKLVGVTQKESNGTDRQSLIASKVFKGQPLILKREPDNPHDSNAISAWVQVKPWFRKAQSHQLGYISADVASRLSQDMDRGADVMATVKEVTGGGSKRSLGVNVVIKV